MTTTLLFVQALNGLQFGLILFLIAAGLTLVFGVMDFINLAHGVQYMVGRLSDGGLQRLDGQFRTGASARASVGACRRSDSRSAGLPSPLRSRSPRSGAGHVRRHPVPEPGREVRLGRGAAQRAACPNGSRARSRSSTDCSIRSIASPSSPQASLVAAFLYVARQSHPRRHAGARGRRRTPRWCPRSASISAACS